ncbi:MAG: tetratricopeptide repeat protein [Candidatus Omnitrophica bacterium]|nr:tetratricopeptide repeat protein [Candidatus Omnitrophota bacterium]
MNIRFQPKVILITIITLCIFCFDGLLFAQEELGDSSSKEIIGAFSDQARKYREEGLENQRVGNLPAAMSLYQKAIALDPAYAVAYNDLGVIYEAAGFTDRAKESYFKAIKVDPAYLSAYTNIALLYEEQRDLERAAFYWAKRAELGSLDDPWTQKAASRFKDIRTVLSNRPVADAREEDILGLIKDVSVYKSVFNKADKVQAQNHLRKANQYYKKRKLTVAIKEALQAQDLDQANSEIKEFIEKIDADPASAAAYNDLGVIYEAAGFPDRAEESYLKAVRFDPTLLSAYVNIALFYEKQRDLEKAEFYWAKRAELGSPDNPWKQRAANRVKDILTVLSSSPLADARESEVLGLIRDVAKYKSTVNRNDKALARDHFNRAKQNFNRGDLATAIKEALDAQYLDQDNPEIEAFIEKAELRALSR